MNHASPETLQPQSSSKRLPRWKHALVLATGVIVLYLLATYVVVPLAWKRYSHRHPGLDDIPGITQTADGIPGDPLNVALIGTETEVKTITHNPTVIRARGKYYLYYMGNTGDGSFWSHRNNQRIGVAVADKPEGPWRDLTSRFSMLVPIRKPSMR